MKKLAIASALLSAIAFTGTAAHAYQAEVGGSLGYVDPDRGSSGESYGLNGTYYFNPVQTRNSPLAEAAFLDRASNVGAHISYKDVGRSDETIYGVTGEYFVPDSDFYMSAAIGRSEVDEVGISRKNKTTTYSAELGYLPVPGLLVAAGVKGYDNKNNDGIDPTIRAKYVTTLENGKDINVEGSASFGDLDEYFIGADYYLDKTLSLGVDYYDNDLENSSEFGIKARKFINPQFSLDGRVGFGDIGNNDYNKFSVGASYRF
jgi:hypothetical protein